MSPISAALCALSAVVSLMLLWQTQWVKTHCRLECAFLPLWFKGISYVFPVCPLLNHKITKGRSFFFFSNQLPLESIRVRSVCSKEAHHRRPLAGLGESQDPAPQYGSVPGQPRGLLCSHVQRLQTCHPEWSVQFSNQPLQPESADTVNLIHTETLPQLCTETHTHRAVRYLRQVSI